ncbi:MAG: ATP-dependent Clp protease ATP-binding subunit [Rikenellaceae bacterium]
MRSSISRSLGGMIARATFTTTKHGVTHSLLDHLFLEIISYENSHAFQTLATIMESWQLYQLRLKVEQSTKQRDEVDSGYDPELYYGAFLERLMDRYPDVARITSLHALHAIAADTTTATSQNLEHFGVSNQRIEQELVQSSANSEMTYKSNSRPTPDHSAHMDVGDAMDLDIDVDVEKLLVHPLETFGVDLTLKAREGKIDPVVGREVEIERVTQILSRRKKNNPMLIGEAGVGKSAVVEGLALRIVSGEVPAAIKDKKLFSLDLSALVAGTKFRGEFEERMKQLLDALRSSNDSIIFIDEIHTIVGAGSSQGSLDVANILKPALSRGEIQTIGATTLDEYRQDIESDAALVRRFQKILVEPTTENQTLLILQNIAPHYEEHHQVTYSPEALEACISLSVRYIPDQYLPDKAIDLLDEAGTLAQLTLPATRPLIGVEDVETVVTMITGIPTARITVSDTIRLKGLGEHLHSRVIGQAEAVDSIVRTIKRSRAGLRDEKRPIGTFLFVGPTGVGKTLLAKELSSWMFDKSGSMLRIDMSEYSLSHSVSRLIGSPPGYVGYGEGGQLTEPVRREPYSVVLLDEIEKAHSDIYNLLLQLLDEGFITDGAGRKVDFRNTIIIITSNVGSRKIAEAQPRIGFGVASQSLPPSRKNDYHAALKICFSPEFLNRIDDVVIFNDLELKDIEKIVDLELDATFGRVKKLGYDIRITSAARQELAEMGYNRSYGARSLRRTLVDQIEEPMANMIIDGELKVGDVVLVEKRRYQGGVTLRVE